MLNSFSVETFSPLVGDTFRAEVPGGTIDLVLGEATGLPSRPIGRPPFTLVFREPASRLFPQGTYTMAHPGLGSFELFLVPLGADPNGMRYEAVFG